MITRKIGNLVRGKATPFQILAATILGSLLAFIPGFSVAPGLILCWVALLVVLNANLFLAGVTGLVAKLAALLLAPVSFAAGRMLLGGPTRGFFETLVNAPVFAWFGFDYFLVTGGQLIGLLFGIGAGVLIVRALRSTWRKLATLEKDSAAFQQWSNRGWVKATAFVFVGGVRGKRSYEEVLARRLGNPIRIAGVVVVLVLLVAGFVAVRFFDSALVTAALRSGLEKANGATVDLAGADVDLAGGEMTVTGLAMADPDKLDTNLFAAQTIEAKISTSDLLRKRATVDSVIVTGATNGEPRSEPGRRIGPPPDTEGGGWTMPDLQSPEELLKNAQVWRERLATVRRWLSRFTGSRKAEEPQGPSYEEQWKAQIRALGYASVRDETLVQQAPRLVIRHLEAGQVVSTALPDDSLTIVARNLATEPSLLTEAPQLSVTSASGRIKVDLTARIGAEGAGAEIDLRYGGLAVDPIAAQLKSEGTPPVQGGTMDIAAQGVISTIDSNLPITATLHNTTLQLGGTSAPVAELPFPLELHGPIDHPGIRIDTSAVQQTLVDLGKREAARRLQEEAQKRLGIPAGEGSGNVQDAAKDAARGLLDGFLSGRKSDDAEKKQEETAPPPARP